MWACPASPFTTATQSAKTRLLCVCTLAKLPVCPWQADPNRGQEIPEGKRISRRWRQEDQELEATKNYMYN